MRCQGSVPYLGRTLTDDFDDVWGRPDFKTTLKYLGISVCQICWHVFSAEDMQMYPHDVLFGPGF